MRSRILHIITRLELGGAQKNALDIVSRLDREKYEVHLIASDGLLAVDAKKIPGLRLVLWPFLRRRPNPLCDGLSFLALVAYIRRHRICIVHTHSSKAGILGRWAAWFAGTGVMIHSVHGWGFHDQDRGLLHHFYVFLEKMAAKITTRFIVVSEHDREKGLACGIGRREQYVFIHYGLDRKPFDVADASARDDLKRSLDIKDGEKVIGMVACLKSQKNPMDFIHCAGLVLKSYPKATFLLVGDGFLRPCLEKEIQKKRLEKNVRLLGWRRDVPLLLSLLDIFVLTSLWEGSPFVFLEAMHSGKPVVAYDICGNKEMVRDGLNGFLVPPRQVQAMAARVVSLLENEEASRRLGEAGRKFAADESFDVDFMARRFDGLYRQACLTAGFFSCP